MLRTLVSCLLLSAALAAPLVAAEVPGPHGRFHAEVIGASALPSIGIDRSEDAYGLVWFDAEWPLFRHLTMAARGLPLLLYRQGDASWVRGVGFGVANRVFLRPDRRGAYAEVGATALWTSGRLRGNDSRLNFLTDVALGYRLPGSVWHAAVTFEHISNAGTASTNHGANGLGLAVGFGLPGWF